MAMLEIYQMDSLSMKGIHTSGRRSTLYVIRGKLKPERGAVELK